MGFSRSPMRGPSPVRVKGAVFAVGRLMYVAGGGDRSVSVTLTDDGGTRALASLRDGTPVAILAWRPGSAGNTRYCVRTTDSGLEGWLPVGNLRGTKTVMAAPANIAPPNPAVRSARLRVEDVPARPSIRAR